MEEKRHKEEELKTSFLPHKPYPWLLIHDPSDANGQCIFYSIPKDGYYVRFVPELQNKVVTCCNGQWLVLCDWYMRDCSILNMFTMEKFQLPSFPRAPQGSPHCVLSSSKMDRSCRVILFKLDTDGLGYSKFRSCHIGDSEVIEGQLMHRNGYITDIISFKGKLYALTTPEFNLLASDFSDPGLGLEQVVSGQSVTANFIYGDQAHLVESCEDLLLIYVSKYDYHDISDVRVFKADFSIGKWVKLETLGGRAIFLGSLNKSFSSPALTFGVKGNVVYWIKDFRYLCVYDIEDKSISMSLPFPGISPSVETYFHFSWASFPMTCNEEKKLARNDMSFLFEAFPIETTLHVQRGKATIESTDLQIEQRKPQKREETNTIGKTTIFRKESLWEDLPNDLLLEIFQYLFGGDRVTFRSVCRSWYSILPSTWPSKSNVLPFKDSDCSSPFLMCPDNKICHPIFGDLFSMDFLDIPGSKVRAARFGWLLMDNSSSELFFYNPVTKEEIKLPDCAASRIYSVFFSAPPTSPDCLVVAAKLGRTSAICYTICFMKIEDEVWTCYELSQVKFRFSNCNAVAFKDQFYFLGNVAKLLIFCPKNNEARVIEAPKFIYNIMFEEHGQQYMLESDGKLIAVFFNSSGSSVYTCEYNVSRSEWEIIESLENIMLFISRPLSLCKRATVRGTGNKIYFPGVVGEGHILFYSLATKRYHTFEMGTSYSDFLDSKFYPQHNGWFMP